MKLFPASRYRSYFAIQLRARVLQVPNVHTRSGRGVHVGSLFSEADSPVERQDIIDLIPLHYLRAMDESNFDKATHQRTDVRCNPTSGKRLSNSDGNPHRYEVSNLKVSEDFYYITWKDGLKSKFYKPWVQRQMTRWKGGSGDNCIRIPWTGLTEKSLRDSLSTSFHTLVTNEGMRRALRLIFQYGILLITDTPVDDGGAGVALLASAFGGGSIKNSSSILHHYREGRNMTGLVNGTDGPLRTLYGTVWSTSSCGPYEQENGTSIADSAYSNVALPLHTDMTYFRDPPGLQIFTMVQPATKGGESVFCDGFAAAKRLQVTNPDAFRVLASTPRRYRSIDDQTGWHLEARGPIISIYNRNVISIRHNDLDRLPDLPPPHYSHADTCRFYDQLELAHEAWDDILNDDERRLEVNLVRGETVVVANQVRPSLPSTDLGGDLQADF